MGHSPIHITMSNNNSVGQTIGAGVDKGISFTRRLFGKAKDKVQEIKDGIEAKKQAKKDEQIREFLKVFDEQIMPEIDKKLAQDRSKIAEELKAKIVAHNASLKAKR